MNLGETIYRLRSARNMSQGDLADALEVSRQSVSKWENNSAVPELEKLVRMSEVFGVTLDELVLERKPRQEEKPEAPETRTVYVEKPSGTRKTVGVILLCFAGMIWLVLSFLAGILGALCIAVPFAVCGLICLLAQFIQWLIINLGGFSKEAAAAPTSAIMIIIAIILTCFLSLFLVK